MAPLSGSLPARASRGEKENIQLLGNQREVGGCRNSSRPPRSRALETRRQMLLESTGLAAPPLLGGEGWGEGEHSSATVKGCAQPGLNLHLELFRARAQAVVAHAH
jgi:hypothetical protein